MARQLGTTLVAVRVLRENGAVAAATPCGPLARASAEVGSLKREGLPGAGVSKCQEMSRI